VKVDRALRICQVVPYDLTERGGVKHHALQLARALRAQGDAVTVIGPAPRPLEEPETFGFPGIVNIRANGSDNRVGMFVAPWRVRSFFKRHRFDIVHVHEPLTPSLPYWAVWFSWASAHVATFHAFSEQTRLSIDLLSRLGSGVLRPAFQLNTAVSQAAASYAPAPWRQSLTIVPNGVPTEVFRPRPGPRVPGPARLLFVGRLGDDRKGYRYLDLAFRRLRARGFDVTLDVVGELGGTSRPEPAPGLTYHGPVSLESLVLRYQECDIFVAPSTGQESFGIVLLEAMATALPVICSDIDGYRHTINPRGARMVAPQDAEALENAIAGLVEEPYLWQDMGRANRIRAELYDWQNVAHQVRGLYLSAIRRRWAARAPSARALGPGATATAVATATAPAPQLQEAPLSAWGQHSRIQGDTTLDV
jgi:phosphatidylinositol alpha-mannosyltransferase